VEGREKKNNGIKTISMTNKEKKKLRERF